MPAVIQVYAHVKLEKGNSGMETSSSVTLFFSISRGFAYNFDDYFFPLLELTHYCSLQGIVCNWFL